MARFLKTKPDRASAEAACTEWVDEEFMGEYPMLAEHLGVQAWEDGTERKTSTLFVFCDGSMVKAMLKDRDQGLVAFVTCDTFRGLLECIEQGLLAETLDWRRDRPPQGRGGRGK